MRRWLRRLDVYLTLLKRGDRVVTADGFVGRIVAVDETLKEVSVELGPEIVISIRRDSIASVSKV